MLSVEAMNEPVLMTPDLVIMIPLGFTSTTVPGALMVPAIDDGVELRTRFSVAADELGWLKLTVPPAPTENVFQLMMALVRTLIDIERTLLGRSDRGAAGCHRASSRQLLRQCGKRHGHEQRERGGSHRVGSGQPPGSRVRIAHARAGLKCVVI